MRNETTNEDNSLESLKNPFDLHVLICTNTRPEGQKKSCGPLGADALRAELKDWLKVEIQSRIQARPQTASKIKARVNASGCLDFCSKGIALAIYPQGEFLLKATPQSLDAIKERIKTALDQLEQNK